jgi:hypothetical protein
MVCGLRQQGNSDALLLIVRPAGRTISNNKDGRYHSAEG